MMKRRELCEALRLTPQCTICQSGSRLYLAMHNGLGPKAYLNYLIFDRDFNYLGGGFKRVPESARESGANLGVDGEGSDHEPLTFDEDIVIQEAGYVYIYLSNENETAVEVFFDDFRVEHVKSPVVQMDDYYPFGLTFNSYLRENSVQNKYLFNRGSELQTDLNLGWYSTLFRIYDPAIGRFLQVDPLADFFSGINPYSFALDNPISYGDPDGTRPDQGFSSEVIPGSYWRWGIKTSKKITAKK